MKNKVIQFFNNLPAKKEEQFNEALALYRKCPHKSDGQERFYNRAGFTPANLDNLVYDLKKLVGVTDADIRKGVKVDFLVDEEAIVESYRDTDVIPGDKEKIVEHSTLNNKEEVFTKAPDQVKEAVKFKDEFPFLLEKDCPEEFHILTGQKFAAYYAWIKAHQHLLVNISDINEDASAINLTDEEVDQLALTAVENFEVNDLIWKELNHYEETNEILGKHPIFIERQLKDKIDAMPVADAAKRLTNLDNYIRRDAKKLEKAEKAKNGADIEKWQHKILEWETEQKLIKAKHSL